MSRTDACLDLLRRLHPKLVKQNLDNVCKLVAGDDDLVEELLGTVDVPLVVAKCQQSGKQYLLCDYNRDGDSYRSPWSNEFYPQAVDEDAPRPLDKLRQLEVGANDAFDIYRDLYYDGEGVSLVYLWDTDDEDFAGVVLFKKEIDGGSWDSIHVIEVSNHGSLASYRLTLTVILDLGFPTKLSLSGNMTRQLESTQTLELEGTSLRETAHLINMGQLVEKQEGNIRNLLQDVYFDKLKDILLRDLRTVGDIGEKRKTEAKHADIVKGLQGTDISE